MEATITHTYEHGSKTVLCSVCAKVFLSSFQLECHLREEHAEQCGSTAFVLEYVEVEPMHDDDGGGDGSDILECPICVERFVAEETYENHIKTHYSKTKVR